MEATVDVSSVDGIAPASSPRKYLLVHLAWVARSAQPHGLVSGPQAFAAPDWTPYVTLWRRLYSTIIGKFVGPSACTTYDDLCGYHIYVGHWYGGPLSFVQCSISMS